MAISDRISAMYDHVEDIYDTMALGGDTTSNKNIVNINTEIKREYKDFLANGTDVLWNNWEKVSGTGETLTLNNTMEGKMKVDLKGNTQQNGEPTPDAPIPVQVVSGDNTIKVEGKNLFNPNVEINTTFTSSIATALQHFKDTGEYATGYVDGNRLSNNNIYETAFVKVKPNTSYILSKTGEGNFTQVALLNNEGSVISTTSTWIKPISFTTTSETMYIAFGNSVASINTVQLEYGNQATTYEEYTGATYPISLGNIELCKIGTYQDSIVKDNGKWYLNKQIGKVVLDGSESWQRYGAYGSAYLYYVDNETDGLINGTLNNVGEGLCNYALWTHISDNTATPPYVRFKYNNGERLYVGISNDLTIENFKSMLNTENMVVCYAISPTYTPITDTTLLSQLEALAYSYDEQTNISQVNDDMPFILDITALKEMA